jgi:2-polyprenyl-3-methyl-5-hydroxy-6-metoxy-1,4-benzoquinol methylase
LSDYHKRKVEICATHIRELVRGKRQVKILDVGCGTGELFLFPLWHRVQDLEAVEILGIDIDGASIARANDTVATHSLRRISFRAQSVETLSEAFDLVISTEVIEHLEDPESFLVTLRAVVADDGMLVLSTPNGFGYAEIERRLLYTAFDLIRRLPISVKKTFRSHYQKLRSWRWYRERQISLSNGKSRRKIFATLNFANDIHIQYFTLKRLICILRKSSFTVDEVYNVQLLGGLVGRILESPLDVGRILKVLPNCFAAAWLVTCHTQVNAGQIHTQRPVVVSGQIPAGRGLIIRRVAKLLKQARCSLLSSC